MTRTTKILGSQYRLLLCRMWSVCRVNSIRQWTKSRICASTTLMEEMRRVFQTCDVLMLPTGNAAPKLDAEIVGTDAPSDPPSPPRPGVFNITNVTEITALVLPCGFTAGAPTLLLGIQYCANPFGEATFFRIGHAYQRVSRAACPNLQGLI